ncbi:substrate-binding domain-containing protein [Streptomyces sp. NRRL S-1022]|uniref:substrate-binding domain-containing protein n=1 Tax=Streptomyces sp. NRRL S-1022 TaxID=1463880 RepID=UPI0004BFD197|nr:substrate-binding domain-containing protein [Streptomyces sp. NRRL S-1022]
MPEANDQCAIGVLAVLSRAGVAVPGRVSVAGYGDALPRLSLVDLTTVSQTARHAVRAAVERLDEGREGPREIVLAPLLGIKGITGQAV